jgi:hypothetical protein
MTRHPRKALGLILPLASCAERERISKLVDDRMTAGVHLVVATMEPAYSAGDVALVRPCDTVEAGDYMLRRKSSKPALYRLLRVERVTSTYIFGRQFNPAKLCRLPRKTWAPAFKVTGKYNRDPPPCLEQGGAT